MQQGGAQGYDCSALNHPRFRFAPRTAPRGTRGGTDCAAARGGLIVAKARVAEGARAPGGQRQIQCPCRGIP